MAIQFAAARSAHVVASSRSIKVTDQLLALGANEVIGGEPDTSDFDVILDLVAGDAVSDFVGRLRPNGRYVLAGVAAGMPPAEFASLLISKFRHSLTVATFSLDTVDSEDILKAAQDIFRSVVDGRFRTVVSKTLPLRDAEVALAKLSAGDHLGKIVLDAGA